MMHALVLNQHSLPFKNQSAAEQGWLVFLTLLKECRKFGLKILLVDEDQDSSLMRIELAPSYFVSDWYIAANKNANLKDWCRFLRSVETKQPLFEYQEQDGILGIEVGLSSEKKGKLVLLAAFKYDTFLLSFKTRCWQKPFIDIWVYELNADPEQRNEKLPNLYDENSLNTHKANLLQRRDELLSTAQNIWQQRTDLYPHLTLLNNQIGTALQMWSARPDILLKARDALNVLEQFCEKWQAGEYTDYRHEYLSNLGLAAQVSGESSSVAQDQRKRKERLFWLDDGRQVYCENHIKLPDGYRLHFYPDKKEKRIYVAYLGAHLTL